MFRRTFILLIAPIFVGVTASVAAPIREQIKKLSDGWYWVRQNMIDREPVWVCGLCYTYQDDKDRPPYFVIHGHYVELAQLAEIGPRMGTRPFAEV